MDDRETQQAQPNQASLPEPITPPGLGILTQPEAELSTEQFPVGSEPNLVPAPPQPPSSDSIVPFSESKPKKKKWVLAAVAAAIMVVIAAGGVFAYNFWYQNPDKVVGDALVNAVMARSVSYKGMVDFTDDDKKMNMTFDGSSEDGVNAVNAKATLTLDKRKYSLGGGLFIDAKGTVYFKVSGVRMAVTDFRNQVPLASRAIFDKLVEKVDDQWISIRQSDAKEFSESYAKMQKCFVESGQRLRDDKSIMTEITDVYKKHPFITVEESLGSKDGSLGYRLSSNDAQGKEFTKGLKETKFYKELHKCDSDIAIDENVMTGTVANKSDEKVEVWITRWSHEITKLTTSSTEGGQKVNISLEPTFNKGTSFKAPEDSITLEQLKADITEMMQSLAVPPPSPAT